MVTKLGGSEVVADVEVEAANWMAALRAGRERMGEPGALPAGASCTVDGRGAATILDPSSRRKLVLSPAGAASSMPPRASAAASSEPTAAATGADPANASEPSREKPATRTSTDQTQSPEPRKPRKRFETVGFAPDSMMTRPAVEVAAPAAEAAQANTARAAQEAPASKPPSEASHAIHATPATPATPATDATPSTKKKRFETVAMIPNAETERGAAQQPEAENEASSVEQAFAAGTPARASMPSLPRTQLEPLFERSADPSADNPLTYRERAFFVPRGMSIQEAEAALRFELAELQQKLASAPRGKLVNLAAFDHKWEGAPERPPIVALQWRDWKQEVTVDFPAARLSSPPPPPPSPSQPPARHDDRLDDAFHSLAALSSLVAPVEGLDLAVSVLIRMVPCEAITAALYDINTDELRFVSVYGTGADAVQRKAVPRSSGLLGQALRDELRPTLYGDVLVEDAFDPAVDGRPGLDARSMLLCPISNDGHLLGALQLINRAGTAVFSQGDASVLGYVAERLSEFLSVARRRHRSEPPLGSRS